MICGKDDLHRSFPQREGHRLHTAAIGEPRSILKPESAHVLSSALDPEVGRGYRSEMERFGPSRGGYAPFVGIASVWHFCMDPQSA
jgi:hypothetical protein